MSDSKAIAELDGGMQRRFINHAKTIDGDKITILSKVRNKNGEPRKRLVSIDIGKPVHEEHALPGPEVQAFIASKLKVENNPSVTFPIAQKLVSDIHGNENFPILIRVFFVEPKYRVQIVQGDLVLFEPQVWYASLDGALRATRRRFDRFVKTRSWFMSKENQVEKGFADQDDLYKSFIPRRNDDIG